MSVALPPRPVQFQGSALARRILAWLGWDFKFDGLPTAQGVIVVYPHTSNWDLLYGMLAKWAMGLDLKFWGKHTLFRIPLFGAWLRWMGGVPLNRSKARGVVEHMVDDLKARKAAGDYFWLAMAPEGTRSWGPAWRSGFYRLVLDADVPLGMAVLDYGRKEVRFVEFAHLSGDVEADMARIAKVYDGCVGHSPENAAPIRLDYKKDSQ